MSNPIEVGEAPLEVWVALSPTRKTAHGEQTLGEGSRITLTASNLEDAMSDVEAAQYLPNGKRVMGTILREGTMARNKGFRTRYWFLVRLPAAAQPCK